MARLWRSPFGSGHARVFAADAWYAGDSSSRLVGHLGQPPSRSTHHRSLFCRHRTHRYWSGSGGPNWPSPTISWIDGEALTITTRLSRFEGCYLVLPAFSGCSSLIYSAYGLSWIGILFSFSLWVAQGHIFSVAILTTESLFGLNWVGQVCVGGVIDRFHPSGKIIEIDYRTRNRGIRARLPLNRTTIFNIA